MNVTEVSKDALCNRCLFPARLIYLNEELCFRCYSEALVPPAKKLVQSVSIPRFADPRQGVLDFTGTGR